MNRLICYVTILPQVTPTITSDPLIILAVHRCRLLSLYTAIQIYVLLTYLLTYGSCYNWQHPEMMEN